METKQVLRGIAFILHDTLFMQLSLKIVSHTWGKVGDPPILPENANLRLNDAGKVGLSHTQGRRQ
eukprot:scaffold117639_cov18-Tisochrysis_lutea.AAC.1